MYNIELHRITVVCFIKAIAHEIYRCEKGLSLSVHSQHYGSMLNPAVFKRIFIDTDDLIYLSKCDFNFGPWRVYTINPIGSRDAGWRDMEIKFSSVSSVSLARQLC